MENKVNSSISIDQEVDPNNQDIDYQDLILRLKSIKEIIFLLESKFLGK